MASVNTSKITVSRIKTEQSKFSNSLGAYERGKIETGKKFCEGLAEILVFTNEIRKDQKASKVLDDHLEKLGFKPGKSTTLEHRVMKAVVPAKMHDKNRDKGAVERDRKNISRWATILSKAHEAGKKPGELVDWVYDQEGGMEKVVKKGSAGTKTIDPVEAENHANNLDCIEIELDPNDPVQLAIKSRCREKTGNSYVAALCRKTDSGLELIAAIEEPSLTTRVQKAIKQHDDKAAQKAEKEAANKAKQSEAKTTAEDDDAESLDEAA